MWQLTEPDLEAIAIGAGILGTGGGGNPYVGRLRARQAMREHGPVSVLDPDEVPEDARIVCVGGIGAPTVGIEKMRDYQAYHALRALEDFTGVKATALISNEIGGSNSLEPLIPASITGLPVVDADGMGRAFPELQMETFHVYGVSGTPMVITNEYGDSTIVNARDNAMMEWLARGVAVRMGGAAYIAEYPMDGETAKRVSIPGTLTLGIEIGRCLREARERHDDPFGALIEMLKDTPYSNGRILFEGKVIDVLRRTTGGFVRGNATLESPSGSVLGLEFQNEHLVARVDGQVRAIVPDLICVLETDTAEPITTEQIRYGQRVKVMGISTPEIMRTPEALAVFGPAGFGLDEEWEPVETLGA